LYLVDKKYDVSCHDDIGFLAIGIGSWHASSQLMQVRYSRGWQFGQAIALAYAAKKQAEIAPGVGPDTDLYIVHRGGFRQVPEDIKSAVRLSHEEFEKGYHALSRDQVTKLDETMGEILKTSDFGKAG
jgi:hypothetical protein